MINIHEFKNKIWGYQEGVDYIYDEGKKTYTICCEELKKIFWGDASNEVEYKAMEDSRGNIQFRKSAIFRSSKAKKEENNQNPFVHSVEKMRDKQWQGENLGNFPKITPALPSNLQSEKDNSQIEANFPTGIEEEFGYYKQWEGWNKPLTEHTNTAYHWKKEGKNYFEKKVVWKDNEEVEGIKAGENFSISDKIKEEGKSEASQKVFSSKPDNKDNGNKNIYYGVVFISLVLLLLSMVVVRMKKKR